MNYDFPDQLHDYQFLGKDATDRQRIKRKIESMLNKFSALLSHERNALLSAIQNRYF
jgi:hypothetical protein